jgi:hypothetical protein
VRHEASYCATRAYSSLPSPSVTYAVRVRWRILDICYACTCHVVRVRWRIFESVIKSGSERSRVWLRNATVRVALCRRGACVPCMRAWPVRRPSPVAPALAPPCPRHALPYSPRCLHTTKGQNAMASHLNTKKPRPHYGNRGFRKLSFYTSMASRNFCLLIGASVPLPLYPRSL